MLFEKEFHQLTDYEKDVIKYLNSNPSEFVHISINQIAQNSNVSVGVISRLYKKLGFNSLRDLQFYVHHRILVMHYIDENLEKKNIKNFAQMLSQSYTYSIYKIIENLNNNDFEIIIQKISNSKSVRLYGNSISYFACDNLTTGLQKIGINAYFEKDFHTLLQKLNYFSSKEFFIIFSYSGTSKEVTFLTHCLKQQKIEYLLVTSLTNDDKFHPYLINYSKQDIYNQNLLTSSISQHFIANLILEYIKYRSKVLSQDFWVEKWNKKVKK
ncbi:MurR/RpiR family transcriptional regulator [Mycoplasmopsis cricetuli]|uniref:MurR/RpiR family transcriptional regulator n=1 Tax=Mycoplasmopsis cricetuli TaxID=171283 RepID=UPI0004716BCE|nr:MurR/RpiR family transcriptional regulator [Mycoplasmopsis cricetuli]